ncbi:PRC-barrel domain-containing protein [Risungbinella massiliensis]|uniref:PRC-barrel domain-containing protein n=1 Tax=Risungbinella massiliensis TaxID=1329796 RepID=UPI0005CB9456|nr:PRC-barrel domain-containing protein [Risungbinella massiliensis]
MRRSQEVLGLPVMIRSTGQHLGIICDLLFDSDQRVCGLLVENGGWWRQKHFLPREEILSFGRDVVLVESESSFLPYDSSNLNLTGIRTGSLPLRGRTISFSNGTMIGEIEHVYFLEEMGMLVGYEISDGWLNDLRYGRRLLRTKVPLCWQQETILANGDQIQIQEA